MATDGSAIEARRREAEAALAAKHGGRERRLVLRAVGNPVKRITQGVAIFDGESEFVGPHGSGVGCHAHASMDVGRKPEPLRGHESVDAPPWPKRMATREPT